MLYNDVFHPRHSFQLYLTRFLPEILNPATKLYIQRRINPKTTKLARIDNPPEPVYIARMLTHKTL